MVSTSVRMNKRSPFNVSKRTLLWKNLLLLLLACVAAAALLSRLVAGRQGNSPRAGNQMKAVSVAIERYMQEHDGQLPAFEDRARLETSLLKDLRESEEKLPSFAGAPLSLPLLARPETGEPYHFNAALSGKPRHEYSHPEKTVVLYESRENHSGRLVAFLDGHHIWAALVQWEELRQTSGL
jgi:hypothetical protein